MFSGGSYEEEVGKVGSDGGYFGLFLSWELRCLSLWSLMVELGR